MAAAGLPLVCIGVKCCGGPRQAQPPFTGTLARGGVPAMTGERGPFNSGVEAARKFRWGAQGCTLTAACVPQCKPGNLLGVIAEGRQR